MLGFIPRYVRWTIALLPALLAPAVSLFILLAGLKQTAPAASTQIIASLRQAAVQPQSTTAADVRSPVVITYPEEQPATPVPSSSAITTEQSTLPESGVPTVRSIPVQFIPPTPTKTVAPTATPMPTRRPVYTATASATSGPAVVSRATNTVQPANTKEAVRTPEPTRTPEPDKTGEPDDKNRGPEPDERETESDGK